jgi:murein DD-endopeptidase MepM/ murein hydrolase activator NlpD
VGLKGRPPACLPALDAICFGALQAHRHIRGGFPGLPRSHSYQARRSDERQKDMLRLRWLTCSMLFLLLIAGCARAPQSCPPHLSGDLSWAAPFASDGQYPFRFPLDAFGGESAPFFTDFCAGSSGPESARKYHAAEDYLRPAGTPVYAMADGQISFSGPMGGYGWLIIIDHPQANLYSLYGHLSPSRWRMESGAVEKGALIAYLGDSDENGGSVEHPLVPHLHFGLRAGQRSDYPGKGEWRWQAGWIKPCPSDVGWLQPSAIVIGQEVPVGGFPEPEAEFLAKWWVEILLAGIYVIVGVCMLVFAIRKNNPALLVFEGILFFAAGCYFHARGIQMNSVLFVMAALLGGSGIVLFMRRSTKTPRPGS